MNFFEKYFISPIVKGSGYNTVNTLTYSLLLVLAVVLIYKIMERLDIEINRNFFIGLFPFIMLGGVMRALEDANFFNTYLFVTPGIYVVLFTFGLVLLLISILIDKYTKYSYWKPFFIAGFVPLAYFSSFLNITNLKGFGLVTMLAIFWFIVLYILHLLEDKIFSKINITALWGHLLDASATFTAVSFFSFQEQHVLPSFLFNIFGPVVMFPLKFFVVLLVLYMLDENIEDGNMRYWLKIVIFILGFALGVRDLLSLAMLA